MKIEKGELAELMEELENRGFHNFYNKLVMWVQKPQTATVFHTPADMLEVYNLYKRWYDLRIAAEND